jgi:hypothetical protein
VGTGLLTPWRIREDARQGQVQAARAGKGDADISSQRQSCSVPTR